MEESRLSDSELVALSNLVNARAMSALATPRTGNKPELLFGSVQSRILEQQVNLRLKERGFDVGPDRDPNKYVEGVKFHESFKLTADEADVFRKLDEEIDPHAQGFEE